MRRVKRAFKITVIGIIVLAFLFILALCYPEPLFGYKVSYENLMLYSDAPIPKEGVTILKEAEGRLLKSDIYNPKDTYRIFICNSTYKFMLFANVKYRGAGGINSLVSGNSFLRKSDFENNRLVGPSGNEVQGERTLAYFIAHEVTHGVTIKRIGRLAYYKLPVWIKEGYADYVGKGGEFDFQDNLKKFKAGDKELDPLKSGLYLRYHLLVAYELDIKKMKTDELLSSGLKQDVVEKDLEKNLATQ